MVLPLRFLVASTALVACAVASAQAYRWKDERGVTVYGDVVPPQYKDSAQVELSRSGVAIKKIEAALTPAQRAEQEARRVEEAEAAARKEAVDRIDRALVSKFANAGELAVAHGRDLERVDSELTNFTTRATELSVRAKSLYTSKKLSRDQRAELSAISGDLSQTVEIIERKLSERSATLSRHRLERERFQELMARKSGAGKP